MYSKFKNKKKSNNVDKKRAIIIAELTKKYGVSNFFVRLAIKRERDSELADKIYKEYQKKYIELERIISN